MNIIFVEPFFPQNQRRFVAALAGVGANVIGVALNEVTKDIGDSYYYHGYYGKYARYYNVKNESA